ncbi:MAG: 30S ribosomal protein S6--L-glutamate ligase [Bacteroidota bacterium]
MKIGILSRNAHLYSTRRLADAAVNRGHDVEIIDHLQCNILMEQGKPDLRYREHSLSDIDAIIPRIGASVTYYGAAVVRQFEMMHIFSVVGSQALLRSRDKLRSLQLLAREGLDFPKTAFTNYSRDTRELIDSVGGTPLVIKLLEGTQGLGVVLAETEQAATSVLEAFNGLKARVIVQEFIKEAKGADIRVLVVEGKVVGSMKRQGKAGEFRSNLHRGGSAFEVKLSRKERSAALKAAKAMGLAVAGVDMLQSARGPLILEVNSSPGLEGIERATHQDIASEIISYIERSASKKRRPKDNVGA